VYSPGAISASNLANGEGNDFDSTNVSDVGVTEIARLEGLTTLYLNDTNVTGAGVAELQKALPKCKIEW
jgi:hypothetical protein